LQSPVAFAECLFFGWAAYCSGSIQYGLFAHALDSSLVAFVRPRAGTMGVRANSLAMLAIAVVFLGVSVLGLRRRYFSHQRVALEGDARSERLLKRSASDVRRALLLIVDWASSPPTPRGQM
jgi:hypothetical protein